MESSRVYEDASKAATVIDAALTAANAVAINKSAPRYDWRDDVRSSDYLNE